MSQTLAPPLHSQKIGASSNDNGAEGETSTALHCSGVGWSCRMVLEIQFFTLENYYNAARAYINSIQNQFSLMRAPD